MSTTSVDTAGASLPQPKSFLSRLTGVFASPGETFADIVRKPDFLAPLILGTAASIVFAETMVAKVDFGKLARAYMEHSPRFANMSPEQMDQTAQTMAKANVIGAHVIGVIIVPLVTVVLAAVGLLIVNAILGQRTNFRTAYSVTCWAGIPSIVSTLIGILMVLFGDTEHLNPQNPTPTNPAFFMNYLETSRPLYGFLSSLDIFSFWYLGLLGVGFAAAAGGKTKPLTVTLFFAAFWFLMVLIFKVGLASLG